MPKKSSLGRGMDAVFLDNSFEASENPVTLHISEIEPRKNQPRKRFESEPLAELADSIAKNGLIQPIAVRKTESGFYQIIAGERRWRAAKMAGLSEVPVVIIEADDRKAAEFALIENIQRENLDAVEEAMAYKALIDEYGLTQEAVADRVGKSRSTVTNSMRILDLPGEVLEAVTAKRLTSGHARTLLGIKDKTKIPEAAEYAANKEISVRELEQYVKKLNSAEKTKPREKDPAKKEYYKSIESKLKKATGLGAKISYEGSKKTLTLTYKDNDELERIIIALAGREAAEKMFE